MRQNDKAFDQAGRQHGDHRERNNRDDFTKAPTDNGQTVERDIGRDRCRKNRAKHPLSRIFRRHDARFAQLAGPEIRVFANHNRVIDHNPKGNDQGKQRNHIDGNARQIHQRNGGQHRNRNAHRNPECRARVQEQKQ